MKRKTPTPFIVTCDTEYGGAYCWKIDAHGLMVLGNTRLDCCLAFLETYEFEYGRAF